MMSIKNILISIVAISVSNFVHASNFNKPHAHTGKVEPFVPGDPNVKLDGKAKSILKSGKPYQVNTRCMLCMLWIYNDLTHMCIQMLLNFTLTNHQIYRLKYKRVQLVDVHLWYKILMHLLRLVSCSYFIIFSLFL